MNNIFAFLCSFLMVVSLMPFFIRWMHHLQKQGQPIRENGPATHFAKKGTPTMGGVLVLFAILVSTLIFIPHFNYFIGCVLIIMIGFGLLGFEDDYYKLKKMSANGGLSGRRRLLIEILLSGVVVALMCYYLEPSLPTRVELPILHRGATFGLFYILFAVFMITGTTNAVNLTDGLDGLVSMPLILCFLSFGLFAFIGADGFSIQTEHFQWMQNISVLCPFCASVVGALCGFLIFNKKPAKIFMGDVGALGLGGALAMVAILTKKEILLGIVGALFVIEALSDIIQVSVYKKTKKRVFLMAPIHHHFEKKGWSEVKVVRVFWLFALICAILGVIMGVL